MWYYAQNGERKGPVSEDALREMARDGSLNPTDLVWREGMAEWATAELATGFRFGGETIYGGAAPAPAAPSAAAPTAAPSYGQPTGQQASPYAAPQAQIAASESTTDYLPWAIAGTILCCVFTGIAATVYSVKTKSAQQYGDWAEAERCGRLAKIWFWWTFGLGFTYWALIGSFYVLAIASAVSEMQ
ncbi:MAG TPA: CD225/dispanin family protein [Thermoanaerobaculia bacterium]|nr:CD225/dispanin family protein [Thermoanaerobaculia bacterium]